VQDVDRLSADMLGSNPNYPYRTGKQRRFPRAARNSRLDNGVLQPSGREGVFILVRVWLSAIKSRSVLQGHSRRCGWTEPAGKTERWANGAKIRKKSVSWGSNQIQPESFYIQTECLVGPFAV